MLKGSGVANVLEPKIAQGEDAVDHPHPYLDRHADLRICPRVLHVGETADNLHLHHPAPTQDVGIHIHRQNGHSIHSKHNR